MIDLEHIHAVKAGEQPFIANDGLWYEGWEGNYDLVKINLRHEDVINHILDSVKGWVEEFDSSLPSFSNGAPQNPSG